jgi:hypothetical protein
MLLLAELIIGGATGNDRIEWLHRLVSHMLLALERNRALWDVSLNGRILAITQKRARALVSDRALESNSIRTSL